MDKPVSHITGELNDSHCHVMLLFTVWCPRLRPDCLQGFSFLSDLFLNCRKMTKKLSDEDIRGGGGVDRNDAV